MYAISISQGPCNWLEIMQQVKLHGFRGQYNAGTVRTWRRAASTFIRIGQCFAARMIYSQKLHLLEKPCASAGYLIDQTFEDWTGSESGNEVSDFNDADGR